MMIIHCGITKHTPLPSMTILIVNIPPGYKSINPHSKSQGTKPQLIVNPLQALVVQSRQATPVATKHTSYAPHLGQEGSHGTSEQFLGENCKAV